MPQQQQTPPVVFTGLSLSSNGGELPPGASPVFHNCDISPDGDVIRRPGSNYVGEIDLNVTGSAWSSVIKTRKGNEYLVTVSQTRITIHLISEAFGAAFSRVILVKQNVFSRTLTDVNFIVLSAPYDRLLILTPNHPPVQLSFLERTLTFTCTNAGTGAISAPSVTTDSPLWRDNTVNGTFIANLDFTQFYLLTSKSPGFTMTAPSLGMALNEVRDLNLVQISWQWWAEALYWKGKDFSQNTMRYSVTTIDQNMKIPADLITDLDPRYLESAYRGILLSNSNNFIDFPPLRIPSDKPATAPEWSHGSGQRYNYAANIPLTHTPFYATFQGIEAVGTQTPYTFWRVRELRFNANTGVLPANLAVYVGGILKTWRTTTLTTHPTGDYILYTDTYTTQRNVVQTNVSGLVAATGISPYANGQPVSFQADVLLINKDTKWLGSAARNLLYTDLPTGGGTLDGTYVAAYGLGAFCDYLRGRFTPFGCLFRDRLVLKTADESIDQLVLSATSDTLSPGDFYNFFQITDALSGVIDDPFTINITAKSREKITALLGWQQSLFVFTSVSTYSINGGELFGPDSFTTGLIASYGAFNTRCVVATNLTVLFLNRFGLFDLINKNNTTDYGSFERSEAVRAAFLDVVIPPNQDLLPWLSLNDTNNKVYLGLPTPSDVTACKRILSLNLSWNSWSTISSATTFNACVGLQLLNWTVLIVKNTVTFNIQIVQMDATHNLDFAVDLDGASIVAPYIGYPYLIDEYTENMLGMIENPLPSPPVLREYTFTTKRGVDYYRDSPALLTVFPRNWMFDVPELTPFLDSAPEGLGSPLVLHHQTNKYPVYPRITARTTTSTTFGSAVSADGTTLTTAHVLGTSYPSVFATPTFNASSLGRLKRLKRLHLLFDNRSVLNTKYYNYPNKQLNSAIVVIGYNYGEGDYVADAQLVGDYLRFDAMHFDTTPSSHEREQISVPLSGYGCDYQLFLCSTGGDAFKLSSYEFDIQATRTKTYVRE
jgi:hypothetical protein